MRRKIPFAPVPPVPEEKFTVTLDQLGHFTVSTMISAIWTIYVGRLAMRTAQLEPHEPDPTPDELEELMREAFDVPIETMAEDNPYRAWLIRYRDNQAVAMVNPKPRMRAV